MPITSLLFFLFVLFLVGLFYTFRRWQTAILTLGSIFFILLIDLRLLIAVLFSVLLITVITRLMALSKSKRLSVFYLCLSIMSSLFLLFIAKYINFSFALLANLADLLNLQISFSQHTNWIAGVGISFLVFKQISFSIDSFKSKKTASFSSIILHQLFFPEFLSGPIQRYDSFLSQIKLNKSPQFTNFKYGLNRILIGIFKKLVVANSLAAYTNPVYSNPLGFSSQNILVAIFVYSFQIYVDFDGYTDIAIGVSRLFGFRVPENFNRPYLAISIKDFWRRWHITLSSWFKDYLYIPLGGNRRSSYRNFLNIIFVFAVTGIWHGANLSFVVWGLLHGLFVGLEGLFDKVFQITKRRENSVMKYLSIVSTFILVSYLWVFFRASSLDDAFSIVYRSLTFDGRFHPIGQSALIGLCTYGFWQLIRDNRWLLNSHDILVRSLQIVKYGFLILSILLLSNSASESFIYFQF